MTKADSLTGVKCFSIGGRMIQTRERCLGMTDEERRWRAQWLKDQVLTPDEPKYVPEYYKQTNNIFRRLWNAPMNKLQTFLKPSLGADWAYLLRHTIAKSLLGIAIVYGGVYFIKYHSNDFTSSNTLGVYIAHRRMYPFDPNYPNYIVAKTPSDHYDQGFYSSVLCQDAVVEEEDIPPPPPPPPPPEPEPEICPALEKEE